MQVENRTGICTEDEPGDGTHYEFVLMRESDRFILIMRGSQGARFDSYTYRDDSLSSILEEYPVLGTHPTTKEYENAIGDSGILADPFIGYMSDHSTCNVWTAVAAIRAAIHFMKMEKVDGFKRV